MILKKFVLFLMISFFLFALVDFGLAKKCNTDDDCQKVEKEENRTIKCLETKSGKKKCVRALEIIYPKIGKEELTTKVIAKEGLPVYIKYVFDLVVTIIGFAILGALIYNGIRYLTSAGNPEQMADAKNGILAAFLGGLILLSAVLIFNAINPQLITMELAEIEPLEQPVVPGVYICSYKADGVEVKIDNEPIKVNIADVLKNYISDGETLKEPNTKEREEQIERRNKAAKILRAIMKLDDKRVCPRVTFSGQFQNYQVTKDKETIFIVPKIDIIKEGDKKYYKATYEYGIVLHENDNFSGQCFYYPRGFKIYRQIDLYSAMDLPFTARSVTVFQKPSSDSPVGDGVTLYRDFNFNRDNPEATSTVDWQLSFKPDENNVNERNVKKVGPDLLGSLKEQTRSISFSPKNPPSYLALLYEGENFDKRCKVVSRDMHDLTDFPVGACNCQKSFLWFFWKKACIPCLKSMIVIRGTVL